jgi:PAS domain S-box-containing protein
MAKPLTVLIIEDNKSDAQLLVRMLTKAGYSLTFERVETAAQMRAALEQQTWEIVISDFSMPELDGFAALQVLQETGLDIPFIVVSGTMGEETAVTMMKAGAHDYVMKSNLPRLIPAVERELQQAEERRERKRADEALRVSEQQHRTLLQTAMDGFWLVDMQGELLEVNETYCQMSGYTEQELLGMRISDLEDKEASSDTASHVQKVMEQGEDRFDSRHHRKDGSVFEVEINAQYRANEGGQFVVFLQDITERKQAEQALRESNELLSLFMKNSPIYAFIKAVTPSESRNLRISDNYQDMLGIPASEMVGKSMDELFPADIAAKMTADDWAVVSNGVVLRLDEDFNGRNYTTIKFPVVQGDKTLLAGYTIDITERKRAEEVLKQEQALSNAIIEAIPGTFYMLNEIGQYVRWNAYQRDEIVGKPDDLVGSTNALDTIHPDDRALIQSKIVNVLANDVDETIEGRVLLRGGPAFRWLLMTGRRMLINNRPFLVGIGIDISARKQAEEALQKTNQDYRMLSENSPDLIARFDTNLRHLYVNPAAAQSGKLSADEYTGLTIAETGVDEPTAAIWEQRLRQVLDTGKMLDVVDSFPTPDGNHYFNTRFVPELAPDGSICSILSVARDITERKQAEEKLAASEGELRALFAAMTDVVIVYGADGRYTKIALTNPINHYRPLDDMLGKTVHDILPKEQANYIVAKIDEAIQTGRVVTGEYTLQLGGKEIWFAASASRLSENTAVWVAHDITERKQNEQKLREYSEHLEEMVAERTRELTDAQEKLVRQEKLAVLGQLAGGVGHELRNPLAVINAAIYYLKLVQPDASDKVREYHAMIEQEVRNSEKIITDLLDFARIKSVDREAVSVSEIVQRVLERYPVPPSVTLSLDLSPYLPKIYADPRHVEQVLGNLVLNACQAMKDGGQLSVISRQASVVSDQLPIPNPQLLIIVRDTGVGISPENMSKLFEPLFTTKIKGIGLGLAISKKLIEANGGRIEVKSEAGKGSTFTLVLPAKEDKR